MTTESHGAKPFARFFERWLSPAGYLGLHLVVGFLVALAAGLLFDYIEDEVFEAPATLAADARAQQIAQAIQTPWLTALIRAVTVVGNPSTITVLTVVVVVVLLMRGSRRRLAMFLATMTGGPLLNTLLKMYYQRARPSGPSLVHASGYSFPSGHSMGSMLFFGSLAYVVYFTTEWPRPVRLAAAALCLVLVVLVGGSRVYLGVHYLSDVVAGFAAGLCWIGVCLTAIEAWIRLRDWRRARLGRT